MVRNMPVSVYNWQWVKRPGAHFKNGFLIDSAHPIFYYPGQYQIDILNSVIKVSNEETAIQFAEQWGFLGISGDTVLRTSTSDKVNGALTYIEYLRGWQPAPDAEFHQILTLFNQKPKPGDSLSDILRFTQRIKHLTEIRRILDLYHEDPFVAQYDAEQWINNLQNVTYFSEVCSFDLMKEQFKSGGYGDDLNKYLLDTIMFAERSSLSYQSNRSIWIEINESHIYNPKSSAINLSLMFSSFSKFIEYSLLVGMNISPKICRDPKCRHIFFPEKSDQKYCPPPPGVKRSRCEGRHSQEIKRKGGQP